MIALNVLSRALVLGIEIRVIGRSIGLANATSAITKYLVGDLSLFLDFYVLQQETYENYFFLMEKYTLI